MSRINEEDTQPIRLHPETNLEKRVILKGDFAEGERTLPPEPIGPDFARGMRTIPASKSVGDFASGERTTTAPLVVGDFASGEHDGVEQTPRLPVPVTLKRKV